MTFADLPAGERSRWYPRLRVLLIGKGLTQSERRCAVAHEMVHAERGDEDAGAGTRVSLRQEQHADREAARRLITVDDLVAALLWANDDHELADELHVDQHTLRVRLDTLTEGERTMVEARLWTAEAGLGIQGDAA